MTIIDLSFSRSRTVLLTLLFVLIFGAIAYQDIPKEAEPDIAIPFIYVSMRHEGISPEDAERLLVKPMEKRITVNSWTKRNAKQLWRGLCFGST